MRVLPVAIAMMFVVSHAIAKESPPAVPLPETKREFDGFITKFRDALKADDAVAVSAMTRLPYQGDDAIRNADQFRAKVYKSHFTAKKRACIRAGKALYDRDGEGRDVYFIFCGDDIFIFTRTSAGFLLTEITLDD